MARYSSDSESGSDRRRSSKKSKRKSKSRRRSRSSSYDNRRSRDSKRLSRSDSRGRSRSSDRNRRSSSRSRDERRRRRRSRSGDSYRGRRSRRRSRSRSPKSRSSSRDDWSSRRRRSKSRDRSSVKRSQKSKKRSRERSSVKNDTQSAAKPKDPCEDIPGFAEMTPAQQSRLRVQAAFKAVEANSPLPVQGKASSANAETALDQMERAQVIADIDDDGFMPAYFSSSRSSKTNEAPKVSSWPTSVAEQEDYHEMAIFGNSSALGLDEKSRKQISEAAEATEPKKASWKDRDPKTLAHPNLCISKEEADKRWIEKLTEMRTESLKSMG